MQSDQSDSNNHLYINGSAMASSNLHSADNNNHLNGSNKYNNSSTKNSLSIHMNNDHTNQNSTNNGNNLNESTIGNNSSSLNSFNGNGSTNNNNNLNNENYHENNGNHMNQQIMSSQQYNFSNSQKDVLRLIGQHLRYLGLNKTTEMLIKESGCMLEHPIAADFCHLIMSGNWEKAELALNNLKAIMNDENSLNDIVNMRFLILEQKYLECLEDGKIFEALRCLRDELAPLKFNTDRLHELSSFLMCSDQLNLKSLSKWAGKNEDSRQSLMDKLQTFLPPNIMLPPHRLESLLNQSIEYQCEKCPYHNYKEKFTIENWSSFLRDHICNKDDFPSVNIQTVNDHCDEVWYCKFSNNGKRLASGSKDGCLIIWDVDPETYKLTINKTYEDHSCGVALIEWSPDDHYLLVCGTEESTELWIWDVENKVLKKRLNNSHDDSLTSAAWLPDGQSFVCGGMKGHFYNCDLEGNIRETWEGVRVRCLQTLPDGVVLAADSLKRIRTYNFKDITDSNLIQEDFQIMSFSLNKTKTLILINAHSQGLHLWDIKDKCLVRRFQGSVNNNYMNYSTFGGADEIYLASGSEDNRVYIWNIKKEQPISVLEGHTRSVTCVTWNPEIPGMVVSASDDGTLRVWGPKSKNSNLGLANSNSNSIDFNQLNNNNNNNNSNSNNNFNNNEFNMRDGSSGGSEGGANNNISGNGASSNSTSLQSSLSRFASPFFAPNQSSTTNNQSTTSNNRSDRSTPV